MKVSEEGLSKRIKSRHSALIQNRDPMVGHWKNIRDGISPSRGIFNRAERGKNKESKLAKVYDHYIKIASRTFSSGMMAGISSPARPWFRLATQDPDLVEYGPVKEWLELVTKLMKEIFNRSNLYNSLHTLYGELGDFGTSGLMIFSDFDTVIHTQQQTIGTYCLGIDDKLMVDTIYREMLMTTSQLVTRFGIENVSDKVRLAFRDHKYDREFEVLHSLEPRYGAKDSTGLAEDMRYQSIYSEIGNTENKFLNNSGFKLFPGAFPRWETSGSYPYGLDCPGMTALPDSNTLQLQQKNKQIGILKNLNPPLIVDPSLKNVEKATASGGITYAETAAGREGLRPLYQVNPRITEISEDIREVKQQISEAYYADLFQMMINSDRRQITAREVDEKHEEKLIMLGPILEGLHRELLDPVIDITFSHMVDAGILPDSPPEMEGEELQVTYISLLAQAQQSVGIGAIDRLTAYVASSAELNPEIVDKVDFDQTVDEYAEMLGVPNGVVRSDEDVQELRDQRAQAQQAAAAAEQAQAGAETAKTLSETDTSEGALDDILGAVNPDGQNTSF